jgi:hypothetical protein
MQKWIDPDGYVRIWDKKKRRMVCEHRKIYEEYYKCCLLKWIAIHHKNKIKIDNRIENLEPQTFSIHTHNHHPNSKYWMGKHLSEETKIKLSEKGKQRIPWNKGKKTGQTVWNKGKKGLQKHTDEWKEMMSKKMKGNQYAKKSNLK